MQTISVLNAKGGVAKSVTAAAFAVLLRNLDKKVLVVDLDPQANVSSLLGGKSQKQTGDIFKEGFESYELSSYINSSKYSNVDIIPGDNSLTGIIYELYDREKKGDITYILKNMLNSLSYDYVIIDNSPFTTYLTTLSLAASDLITAPIDVDNFSYEGLLILLEQIQKLNRQSDIDIKFKIFFTKVNNRTNLFKSLKEQYKGILGNIFCETYIRQDNAVRESVTVYEPVPVYAPRSNAVEDYISLIGEILKLSEKEIKKIKTRL